MKQTPEMKKIQAAMAPGVLTLEGFLGHDRRPLQDILIEDAARVQRLGLTHKAIAHAMAHLRDEGAKGIGLEEHVEPHFEVLVEGMRGGLPCPFGCAGLVHKVNTTVENTALGERLTYTDLSIHLIEHHGFYQGKGAYFRLEPETLKRVLEITPVDAPSVFE